jgi:hypothetical protein
MNDAVLYAYGKSAMQEFCKHGADMHAVVSLASRSSDREKIAAAAAVYAMLVDQEDRTKRAALAGAGTWVAKQLATPARAAAGVANTAAGVANTAQGSLQAPSLTTRVVDMLAGTDVGSRVRSGVADVAGRVGKAFGTAADAAGGLADDVQRLGSQTDADRFEAARPHLPYWLKQQLDDANDFTKRPLTAHELPAQITSRDIAMKINGFLKNRGLNRLPDYLQTKIDKHLPAWKPPSRPIFIKGPDGVQYRVTRD